MRHTSTAAKSFAPRQYVYIDPAEQSAKLARRRQGESMKTEYVLLSQQDQNFDPDAVTLAAATLIPHLIGRELEYNEAYGARYIINTASICIAWMTDAERLEADRLEHMREHPNGKPPFRRYFSNASKPAGMALLFYCERPWKREGRIEDVVVHPDYRKHGIGREIMKRLISEAKAHNLALISLTSKPERIEARRLYATLGFEQAETNVFRLKL